MDNYINETMTCPKTGKKVLKYGRDNCAHSGNGNCCTCHFEPDPKPGMGCTNVLWSDTHAYTISRVSPSGKTFWARRDKVERDPAWKPEIVPGGFAGHCTNNREQAWICTPDPNAEEVMVRKTKKGWKSGKYGRFFVGKRMEYYDYNF